MDKKNGILALFPSKMAFFKRAWPKRNKHKSRINQPKFNSAIDFRPLAVFTLTKVNEKQRLAHGGFELA